jgi:hypothetical protein
VTAFTQRALALGAVRPATDLIHARARGVGAPLDRETRAVFDSAFNHDFSPIRIHTNEAASRAADAAGARAYTVGTDLIFASGLYHPTSTPGRALLAHELSHAVQQDQRRVAHDVTPEQAEREAQENAVRVGRGDRPAATGRVRPRALQRNDEPKTKEGAKEQPKPPAAAAQLDETARRIIAAAKDEKKSIDQRAIDAVKDILKSYWDASLVKEVVYEEKVSGLQTAQVGSGATAQGKVFVAKDFVDHIDFFARRVIQVGHEVEHVRQYRRGLSGDKTQDEREFLANAWSAREPAKAGTGEMPPAMRRDYADEALRRYCLMPEQDRKRYTKQKDALREFREEQNKKARTKKDAPAECATP